MPFAPLAFRPPHTGWGDPVENGQGQMEKRRPAPKGKEWPKATVRPSILAHGAAFGHRDGQAPGHGHIAVFKNRSPPGHSQGDAESAAPRPSSALPFPYLHKIRIPGKRRSKRRAYPKDRVFVFVYHGCFLKYMVLLLCFPFPPEGPAKPMGIHTIKQK